MKHAVSYALLGLVVVAFGLAGVARAQPSLQQGNTDGSQEDRTNSLSENGSVVYAEDFAEDPGYTIAISDNVQDDAQVFWDEGPDDFFVEARNRQGDAWHAVGSSPAFPAVRPADGFSVSFQFNPVDVGDDRDPGIYFVEAGGAENPRLKTRALEFVIDTENFNRQFRLTSSSGDELISSRVPEENEWYEVTIAYHPASQTVDVEVLRQDGTPLVDQRGLSMEISNTFDQALIGEIESEESAYRFSGYTRFRVDDLRVTTNATRPAPPEQLTASASNRRVDLDWLSSTAPDVEGYNVYRSTSPFMEIGAATQVNAEPVAESSFTDSNLTNGVTYYYRVTTVDADGNESEGSAAMTATPQQESTVAYNEDFDDDPGYTVVYSGNVQGDSKASWDEGPDDFFVEARNRQGDAWHAVGSSPAFPAVRPADGFSVSFQFNPVDVGDDRDPGIYFVEAGGAENPRLKTRALEFVIDTENFNRQFRLTSSSGDELISSRVPEENEWYEVTIAYHPASQTVDVEVLRQDGTPLVDQRGLSMEISNTFDQALIGEIESEESAYRFSGYTRFRVDDMRISTDVTQPTPLPSPPSGVTAEVSGNQVSLTWEKNTASNITGYNVYRSTASFSEIASATKLNEEPISETSYTDADVELGTTYYYRVTAVDESGNESDLSNEVSATPQDASPPAPPVDLTASAVDGHVALEWSANSEDELAGYNVYRSTSSFDEISSATKLNSSLVSATSYTDESVSRGTTYYYRLTAVDDDGNESALSTQVSTTVPERGARITLHVIAPSGGDSEVQIAELFATSSNKATADCAPLRKTPAQSEMLDETMGGQQLEKKIFQMEESALDSFLAECGETIADDGSEIRLYHTVDGERIGHIRFKYTQEDLAEDKQVEAFLYLHTEDGLQPTVSEINDKYPNWDYYYNEDERNISQISRHPVSMLVAPPNEQGHPDLDAIDTGQRPTLLVHGIYGEYPAWGENLLSLVNAEYDTWQFYYPHDQLIEKSSPLLSKALQEVEQRFGYTQTANVVAHSMGGLVARHFIQSGGGDIEYEDVGSELTQYEYSGEVNKLLMLGTPNHGAYMAYRGFYQTFTGLLVELAGGKDNDSPANRQMTPGSSFMYELNGTQPVDLEAGSRQQSYLVVAGTRDFSLCIPFYEGEVHDEIENQDDGAVAVSSASLLQYSVPLATAYLSHVEPSSECNSNAESKIGRAHV